MEHIKFEEWEGLAYLYLDNLQKALHHLERAYYRLIKEGLVEPFLAYNLALCYLNLGKEAQGVKLLDDLTQMPEVIPEAFILLAEHFKSQQDLEKSFFYINQAKEKFPDNEEVLASFIRLSGREDH